MRNATPTTPCLLAQYFAVSLVSNKRAKTRVVLWAGSNLQKLYLTSTSGHFYTLLFCPLLAHLSIDYQSHNSDTATTKRPTGSFFNNPDLVEINQRANNQLHLHFVVLDNRLPFIYSFRNPFLFLLLFFLVLWID